MTGGRPAVLDGAPRFADPVPVTRPTLAVDAALLREIQRILESGMLTGGRLVAEFEAAVAEYLGVAHVVAVSSCTTGLLLTLQAVTQGGTAILPSFTFMATGHAVLWAGLTPVFADCTADTYTLDPAAARVDEGTALVLAVHAFGVPCAADALAAGAAPHGVPLVVDAAHAFGSRYPDGAMAGTKGTAEVFSLSPTKSLAVGEGGLVTTSSAQLAAHLRTAREYGNPGDYDARFAGLNGRLTEINAAIGLAALRRLPERLAQRTALAQRYRDRLESLPGLGFQAVPPGAYTVHKDFTIAVDPAGFGLTSVQLAAALRCEGVDTRRYFDPPLHRQVAYRRGDADLPDLPNTERLSRTLLTLPLYAHLPERVVDEICQAVTRIYDAREPIREKLQHRDGDAWTT